MLGAGSTITPLPSTFRKGFAVAQFEPEALADNSTLAGVKEMALAGATWVEVEPLVTQAHLNSSDPGPSPDTTTDAALVTFIQYARSVGLQVVMKMLLTIDDGASWVYASPTNATEWFQAYGAVLVHYARLGEAQGAQGLCLGTELAHLSIHQEYAPLWASTIAAVRAAAPSLELSYASLYAVEYPNVTFWHLVDVMGIDAYYPVATESNPTPPLDAVVAAWTPVLDELQAFRDGAGLSSMPLVFTEVGYGSYETVMVTPAQVPSNCSGVFASNFTSQATAYTALFTAVAGRPTLVAGMYLFWLDHKGTSDEYPNGHNWPCFFTPRGKPAMDVLVVGYGGVSSG